MNLVIISGRLVYEPELKTSKNGNTFLPVRVAVPRNDKDRNTDFISGRAWGKTGEFIANHFHKGDPIEIIGRLQSENYEKQDGTKVNDMVVMISEANFVLRKSGQEQEQKPYEPDQPKEKPENATDMPFEI